jgi:energy-coupling factor transport system permease protein
MLTTHLEIKETWLHKTNPSFKLLFMLGLFIGVLWIHNLNLSLNYTCAAFLLFACFTGYPTKWMILLLLPFILIFVSTSTSMMLFGKGETTWFQWGWIHITEESFYRGLHLGFRALTFAFLSLTFSLTTKPVLLLYSLMQQLKLKPKYAYGFIAGIRLLPIMLEELQTIRQAMIVRGVAQQRGWRSFFRQCQAYSIPLLSQSIRRAHRIAVAMEAKRFSDNTPRTYYYKVGFSKYDLWLVGQVLILLALGSYFAHAFPYFPVKDIQMVE